MKEKSLLIWIVLLNIFYSSVCSTNVWLHKLVLDLDTPFHCSPQTVWKVRLRIQQSNNRSGLQKDIWRKAETKLCSSQMVTFGILLFTTENCTLLNSYPMTLSLYLLERQSVGLDLKKSWNFHLPVDCGSLKTVLTIGEVIRLNGARIYVGYENGSRKSRQPDTSVNKSTGKPVLTDDILPEESQLFRHSKRFTHNISLVEDDFGKGKVLRGDNKLFLEPFKKSNSELNYTQLELLQEATKLRQKFVRVTFSVDNKNTQSTRKRNKAKKALNTSNGDDTLLRIRLLGKTLTDEKKSERLNNDERIPHKKIDLSSNLTHLFNTKYISSTPSLHFNLTSTDDKIFFISSSIRTLSNIKSNITTDLPVIKYSSRLASKQEKETVLPNAKPSVASYQTVTLKITSFKASTTVGLPKRTSGQQELSPFPTTGKADIITTDLIPKEGQNASTSHKTTNSKDMTSSTIPTLLESTTSSSRRSTPKWKQTSSPGQPTMQETTRMSSQNGRDDHISIINTSPSKTSMPTKTTSTTTSPSKTSTPTKTTSTATSPSKISTPTKTTSMTTSSSKTSTPTKTTLTTTSQSKTSMPTKTTSTTTRQSKTSMPTRTTSTTTSQSKTSMPTRTTSITTSPSKTSTPTKTTSTTTSQSKTSMPTRTTSTTTSQSKTSMPTRTTSITTSPSKTSTPTKTTSTTTSQSKTSMPTRTTSTTTSQSKTSMPTRTTSITTSPSKTSTPTKTTSTTTLLSSLPTTLKASTMISKIATSEFSTWSSRSLTTSPTSDLWVTITSTDSMASTNESVNSTSASEITTFLPHHTDKNLVEGDEDDTYFWPVVLSLVIGIPAIIVFSIAMVVILRKRNIDSSTFFLGSAIGDEEV